ncbi:MAG: MmcQ/YjbR family DNA-binding protein [Odoribacteraceae bacterium]|nr:MmcQ/YjbR family DNA-binding protein [Odoribacteraceae bacterium]
MKYDFIQEYCLSKEGTEEDYKAEWDAIRYSVRGKMYALVGNNGEGMGVITVKLPPGYGLELREQYAEITPGYHFNKTHWNSMLLGGDVPDAVLKKMLDHSYNLILRSLSKKAQKEITG